MNGIYINNEVLYIADNTSIWQTTSSLNSTSLPYSKIQTIDGLSNPYPPIIDSQGFMYIPDRDNRRVVKYLNGTTTIIAGTGTAGAALSRISNPRGLAFDSTESNIFVSDFTNARITMFSVNSTSGSSGTLVAVSGICICLNT